MFLAILADASPHGRSGRAERSDFIVDPLEYGMFFRPLDAIVTVA